MSKLVPQGQRDPRWANIRLGWGINNRTTIGTHGCTISIIATAAGLTPKEVNELFIKHQVYAQGWKGVFNLVNWSRIHIAIPWLIFRDNGRKYHYSDDTDNKEVLNAISDNGFCLVEVDFDGTPRTDDRHWVLFTGNRYQIDPWTGNVTPTAKYTIKTGFCIIDRLENSNTNDNGGDDMSNMYKLPSGKEIDLSNRDSTIVTAKLWDAVVNLQHYTKNTEVNSALEDRTNKHVSEIGDLIIKRDQQQVDALNKNSGAIFNAIAKVLGLPEKLSDDDTDTYEYDEVVNEIKKIMIWLANSDKEKNGNTSNELPTEFHGCKILSVTIDPNKK